VLKELFAITFILHPAEDIAPFSLNCIEQEVLFPPESTFRVVRTNLGVCVIQLEEVEPVDKFVPSLLQPLQRAGKRQEEKLQYQMFEHLQHQELFRVQPQKVQNLGLQMLLGNHWLTYFLQQELCV